MGPMVGFGTHLLALAACAAPSERVLPDPPSCATDRELPEEVLEVPLHDTTASYYSDSHTFEYFSVNAEDAVDGFEAEGRISVTQDAVLGWNQVCLSRGGFDLRDRDGGGFVYSGVANVWMDGLEPHSGCGDYVFTDLVVGQIGRTFALRLTWPDSFGYEAVNCSAPGVPD